MKDYIIKKKKGSYYFLDFIKNHFTTKRVALLIILLLFLCGIYGFARIEIINNPAVYEQVINAGKNPYFEATYWIVTTATTVGYGDRVPITQSGKIISMFVMLLGVTTLGFLASQLVSNIVSLRLGELFGVNKVRGRIDYVICGWNEVSNAALRELMQKHRIVVVDDQRRDELSKLKNVFFIKGNPLEKTVLEKANIREANTALLAMDSDSDVILSIHVIREINPYVNIVAKINNHENILLAKNAGADHIVGPATIAGKLLWEACKQPMVTNWLINNISEQGKYDFHEFDVSSDSPLIGQKVGDIRKKLKAKIIGIDTSEGLERVPSDDMKIAEGNKLILVARKGFKGDIK